MHDHTTTTTAPAKRGHAEIAGAGFAGLIAALSLVRRGWSVRLHERGPALRSEGFSINFWDNGLRVFEALGVLDRVLSQGFAVTRRETRDDGKLLMTLDSSTQMVRVGREHVIRQLGAALQEAGGEIVLNSEAVIARPEGRLVCADGREYPADLVVAADGVNSRIRDTLGVLRRRTFLSEGATRILAPRRPGAPWDQNDTGLELWSGRRRLMIRPTSAVEHYVTLTCPANDAAGKAVPIDIASWKESFPAYHEFFDHLAAAASREGVRWMQFQVVKLTRWSLGRVAVVGDAAHAMPPNLGQGGGCAIVNAFALAGTIRSPELVEEGLRRWEARVRPLTSHTQFWSVAYGVPLRFPARARSAALALFSRSRWLTDQMQRAARHEPRVWATP